MAFLLHSAQRLLNTVSVAVQWCTPRGILVFCLVFLISFNVLRRKRLPESFPPGPRGIPIFGSLLWLINNQQKTLMKWAKIYGNVFSVNFGAVPVVILNGYDSIRNAFVKNAVPFAGRPGLYSLVAPDWVLKYEGVLVGPYNAQWVERRRLALRLMRDLGMGKSSLESTKISEELSDLINSLKKVTGKSANVHAFIHDAIGNLIFALLFGQRFEHEDERFRKLLASFTEAFRLQEELFPQNFLPFLRYLPSKARTAYWQHGKWHCTEIRKYVKEQIDTYTPGKVRSFIDAYWRECIKHNNNTTENMSDDSDTIFTTNQMLSIAVDFVAAGSETVTTTLRWGLLYMCLHPDVQRRVQEELDDVIDRDALPASSHRQLLPYTEATLLEIQRCNYIVPLGVPHCTTEDTTLNGYTIPKDTVVFSNLWSVMMDPELWPEPQKFDPRRFLNKDGGLERREELIPFSLGKRKCLGEELAKMELFLFFTTILHKFTLRLPDNVTFDPENIQGELKSTYVPPYYEMVLEER